MKGKESLLFFIILPIEEVSPFLDSQGGMREAILIPCRGKKKHVLLWQGATAGAQQREPLKCVGTRPIHSQGCAPTFCPEPELLVSACCSAIAGI